MHTQVIEIVEGNQDIDDDVANCSHEAVLGEDLDQLEELESETSNETYDNDVIKQNEGPDDSSNNKVKLRVVQL